MERFLFEFFLLFDPVFFLCSSEVSLSWASGRFLRGCFERDRWRGLAFVGDLERDILYVEYFFVDEAPRRPLVGEFFRFEVDCMAVEVDCEFLVDASFAFKLWISR